MVRVRVRARARARVRVRDSLEPAPTVDWSCASNSLPAIAWITGGVRGGQLINWKGGPVAWTKLTMRSSESSTAGEFQLPASLKSGMGVRPLHATSILTNLQRFDVLFSSFVLFRRHAWQKKAPPHPPPSCLPPSCPRTRMVELLPTPPSPRTISRAVCQGTAPLDSRMRLMAPSASATSGSAAYKLTRRPPLHLGSFEDACG